jgi:hypothetical protein
MLIRRLSFGRPTHPERALSATIAEPGDVAA